MLDQADYTGIDGYIKRHALNDASMAELRRAKLLNINGPPSGNESKVTSTGNGGAPAGNVDVSMNDDANDNNGETELERAQRMIEDAEDEEEEDYEPDGSDVSESGSENGSESGSGNGSEGEDGDVDEADEAEATE